MIEILNNFASSGRGLGNKLFTYAFARILSDELDLNISVPLNSFVERGNVIKSFPYGDVTSKRTIMSPNTYVSDRSVYNIGLTKTLENCRDSHVAIDGYFLKYGYIKAHKRMIKEMYSDLVSPTQKENTVLVMFRHPNVDPKFALPDEYYLDVIKKLSFDKLYLSYDTYDKHKTIVEELKTLYNTEVIDLTVLDMMKAITEHKTLVCAQGTYAFWAAFLSNADKIYFPITLEGPNCRTEWSVDLKVDDEARYIHVEV